MDALLNNDDSPGREKARSQDWTETKNSGFDPYDEGRAKSTVDDADAKEIYFKIFNSHFLKNPNDDDAVSEYFSK